MKIINKEDALIQDGDTFASATIEVINDDGTLSKINYVKTLDRLFLVTIIDGFVKMVRYLDPVLDEFRYTVPVKDIIPSSDLDIMVYLRDLLEESDMMNSDVEYLFSTKGSPLIEERSTMFLAIKELLDEEEVPVDGPDHFFLSLEDAMELITTGEIICTSTISALYYVLAKRQELGLLVDENESEED